MWAPQRLAKVVCRKAKIWRKIEGIFGFTPFLDILVMPYIPSERTLGNKLKEQSAFWHLSIIHVYSS